MIILYSSYDNVKLYYRSVFVELMTRSKATQPRRRQECWGPKNQAPAPAQGSLARAVQPKEVPASSYTSENIMGARQPTHGTTQRRGVQGI